MRNFQKITHLLVAALALSGVILFQNCSSSSQTGTGELISTPLLSPGGATPPANGGGGNTLLANGDGYGSHPVLPAGIPHTITYLHLNTKCQDTVESKIIRTGSTFTKTITDCVSHEPVDVTQYVITLPENWRIIFVDGKLYEGSDSERAVIKNPLQIFCSGSMTSSISDTHFAQLGLRYVDNKMFSATLTSTYTDSGSRKYVVDRMTISQTHADASGGQIVHEPRHAHLSRWWSPAKTPYFSWTVLAKDSFGIPSANFDGTLQFTVDKANLEVGAVYSFIPPGESNLVTVQGTLKCATHTIVLKLK